jgi:nicotinamidase-related amidase
VRAKALLLVFVSSVFLTVWTLPNAGEERERLELKPVLLVIDVQNILIPQMSEEDKNSALQKINESIALFCEFGHPVIGVYHSDPNLDPEPNTEPSEFPDSIAVTDDDLEVVKNHARAFTKTELERILRENGRNTVFLCGLGATGCVLATYFGAQDREFMALMIEGALLNHDASYTKVIEDICSSMIIEEVRETLEDPFL